MCHSKIGLLFVTALFGASLHGNPATVASENQTEGPAVNEPVKCVYARDIKEFEILSEELLLLHAKSERILLNRLATRCSGIRKNMVLRIERYGSQLCANDRIEAHHSGAPGQDGFAASCRLGKFENVAAEQVVVLRRALENS